MIQFRGTMSSLESLAVRLFIISLVCAEAFAILIGSNSTTAQSDRDATTSDIKAAKEASENVTFVYEANEFLPAANSKNEPASQSMTSARNGRMMDLDALVGDFAASRANKERNLDKHGERQSRFMSNLDIGQGKRLHIQGFIPIVGVKDVTGEDQDEQEEQLQRQKQRAALAQSAAELPYAQSSIGHATFGVQRYLNIEAPSQQQQQQAKFSGATVVETLKKPIKKLVRYSGKELEQAGSQQANCICVPFYMCKNGYISDPNFQQQQQQQVEMKSGQLITGQQQLARPPGNSYNYMQQQYTDSFAPIDERSLDKDIITMAPLLSNFSLETSGANELSQFSPDQSNLDPAAQANRTEADQSLLAEQGSEYSKDILARMLGLKAKERDSLYGNSQVGSSQACGLLRSCCKLSQQESSSSSTNNNANERLMMAQAMLNKKQLVAQEANLVQQQQFALQKYQQYSAMQQQQQQQQLPYGYPATQQQMISVRPPAIGESLSQMAHRSSQLQAARFAPTSGLSLAQYTRVAPIPQPLQQMQQQQQQQQLQSFQQVAKAMPSNTVMALSRPLNSQLGSRKILEGRCGLRQSAGITGRVQALQYHESSADFGEYPAQAAILKRLSGSDSLFVCGGTLISQYWIATAAHCIRKHAQSELKVRLGEWDVHRDDEFYPHVEKEVRDLIIHPEFVAGNLVNDIALIRLDSPVDPSLVHVNPACLPLAEERFDRQHCWVVGWGKDSFGQKGSFQAVLREVELPVMGRDECEQALRQTRLGQHYRLHAGFICAGGESGRDACEGDGGSGLYCVQDGLVKVAGLVSWGIGCGQAGVPGVYVNLAHYRPWIENIISIDEDIYSPYSNMLSAGSNTLISERSNNSNGTTTEQQQHGAANYTSSTPVSV